MIIVWLMAASLAVGPGPAPAELAPCEVEGPTTTIDWSRGLVTVTGRGLLKEDGEKGLTLARRAAIVDGYRNLAEAAKGVLLTADRPLGELLGDSPIVQTRLDAYVRGAQVVGQRIVEGPPRELVVTLTGPLRGDSGLSALAAEALAIDPPPAAVAGNYTGLVLDCRAPAATTGEWPLTAPALCPRITDEQGQVLFDVLQIDPAVVARQAGALYYDVKLAENGQPLPLDRVDLTAAGDRLGERPLRLRAWPVAGGDSTVYLAPAEAARFAALKGTAVLREARVVVLRRDLPAGPPSATTPPAPAATPPAPAPGAATDPFG